jgi:AcrR family transcriptional regulator
MSWAIAMTMRISQRRGSGSDDAPDQAFCAPPVGPPGAGTLASDIPTTNLEHYVPFMSTRVARSGETPSTQGTLPVMTAHAAVPAPDGAGDRPLRRDAERNRRRILAAAAEVLSERGLDATLDDVARAAGVGVGTVYRRFPDKESLIEELFRERIDAMVATAEQALTEPDPWQALVSYLDFAIALMAGNMGLRQLLMFSTYGKERITYARDQMRPVITRLVQRAQASGDLRPDFAGTDVKMIVFMLSSVAEYASVSRPDLWRRYLALLIDGLRPARDTVSELPTPPPTAEDIEAAMCSHSQRLGPRR